MSGQAPAARIVPVNDLPDRGRLSVDLATPTIVLAIGAHPDDIEFGCGGTLAKWAASGTTIHHLVLTDGAKGTWNPERDAAALAVQRQDEQRRAAALLGGGDVVFLGRTDGELRNGVAEQWDVSLWIRRLRPDVILGHDPWRRYRLHPDHRHAGFIVTDAIVAARDPHFFTDQQLAPHRPSALLLWEADEPNHVEDIAGYRRERRSRRCWHTRANSRAPWASTTAHRQTSTRSHTGCAQQLREHGALAGLAQGESFHLVTDI